MGETKAERRWQRLTRAYLLGHLRALASPKMKGRESGRAGAMKGRRHIVHTLTEAGVEPLFPGFAHPFTFKGLDGRPTQGVNLVGMLRGREAPETYITLSAHYDHLGTTGSHESGEIFNGADDNASGVAAVLAIASSMAAWPPCASIVFCLFDGEEAGLKGSSAFVERAPIPLDRLALEINVDMIGRGDEGILWVAGTHHHPHLAPHVNAIAAESTVPLMIGHDRWSIRRGENWTHESDHGSFHDAGIPWLHFGVSNHEATHETTDEADCIDEDFFVHAARTVHHGVRHLDEVAEELLSELRQR
jgi:Zn-dependent M28 family amino/carboxypeptidase